MLDKDQEVRARRPKGLIGLHEHGVQKGGDKADTGRRKSLGQVQGSGRCTKNSGVTAG